MNTVIDFTPEIIDEADVTLDDITKSDNNPNHDEKLVLKRIGSKTFRTKIIEKVKGVKSVLSF